MPSVPPSDPNLGVQATQGADANAPRNDHLAPYYDDSQAALFLGDAREVLRALPEQSIHMVCTSPPYWGLRDYGLEPVVWGDASPGTTLLAAKGLGRRSIGIDLSERYLKMGIERIRQLGMMEAT